MLRACRRLVLTPAPCAGTVGACVRGSVGGGTHQVASKRPAPRWRKAECRQCTRRVASTAAAVDSVEAGHTEAARAHVLLVDAMPWIYRAHFGYGRNRLRTSAGLDTTVVYGFFSYLLSMLEQQPGVTHAAVAFDAAGMTFRHELFSSYKGHRPPMPDEIREALPQIEQLLQDMGLAVCREAGVEADDVVGTMAVQARARGALVSIASSDKDFRQLLAPGLQLLRPCKEQKGGVEAFTVQDFMQEYEGAIVPEQFVDVLALAGDSADNVPGVKRVGIKTALALVSKYGSVQGVLEHAEETKPKGARESLCSAEGAAAARLSRELVQIQTDLVSPTALQPLHELRLPTVDALASRAEPGWLQLEFHALLRRLRTLP